MTDTNQPAFAEIAESEATGRTREIYDDFKASIGLPMVNLVYRHMATTPGCLEWAWDVVRPLFSTGAIAGEAERLVAGLTTEPTRPMTRDSLRAAGVDAEGEAIIGRTIEAYNRANPMNLIAMAVLARELEDPAPGGRETPPETGSAAPRPARPLPAMADVRALPRKTRDVLGVLAAQAGVGGTAVVPTLYRHLTDWPGYLGLAAALVAPMADDGSLDHAAGVLRAQAHRAANRMPRYAAAPPAPSAGHRSKLLGLIDLFPDLIARMIVIGVHLRRSMPGQ